MCPVQIIVQCIFIWQVQVWDFFNLFSSIAFLCFWKLDITSNTSCEDTSQGEPDERKKGGKRGEEEIMWNTCVR